VGQRPGISQPIARPGVGNPGVGNRPGVGNPGVGNRPGVGNPGIANRPGVGNPGVGNRPSTLPGLGVGAGIGLGTGIGAGLAGREGFGRRQENVGDRRQNLSDRSQNLQDRLDQRQDFRQDARNDRREDYQNWRDDYYGHHNDWYHGAWSDSWGDHWSHMWSEHTAAMVLGTTIWGLNRMGYWFGTESYANPYYVEPAASEGAVVYYAPETMPATPVAAATPQPTQQPAALPPGVTEEGLKRFDAARSHFFGGQYKEALAETNKAIQSMPTDAVMHEFRGLCLFALGNYREAAATLSPVLAVGPGWDWTTMSSLYPSPEVYTNQLRSLESTVKKTPGDAATRFLLGYHYLACGHAKNALKQFVEVQKLLPKDTVSAQMVRLLDDSPPPAATPSTVKVDAPQLVGSWSADQKGKKAFELTLGQDKSFRWVYRGGKMPQEVKGAFAVDGNVLALEPDAGGVMLAEITAPTDGAFEFRPVSDGAPSPALRFRKQ
jgi:tetratricopeptide (TPR) repeat protein